MYADLVCCWNDKASDVRDWALSLTSPRQRSTYNVKDARYLIIPRVRCATLDSQCNTLVSVLGSYLIRWKMVVACSMECKESALEIGVC